jgi:5'-phosphate synthase pdxT subunit
VNTVGVVSYQGDFEKHLKRIQELGVRALPVRSESAAETVDALIIPGGESTTIGMLLERFGVMAVVRRRIQEGMPVLGTCAGSILLADVIVGSKQPRIGGMHIEVERNAYGRQVESFEANLRLGSAADWERWRDGPVHGVFIRAPIISAVHEGVQTILEFEDRPVLVRQGKLLAATFHPELTPDPRVHEYFLHVVAGFSLTDAE